MDKDFEFDFSSEEEIEEALDGIVNSVGEMIAVDEARTAVLVPEKLQKMQFVHGVIKYLTKGTKAKVTYSLHTPFKSMGSIFVEAMELKLCDMKWFARVVKFADNVDIYPLTNGKIKMAITFHGLVRSIE